MSGLKLTVVMPTKHRISVKVSSKETLLRQVLEDACIKKSLNPDEHQLRRNNKVLDNSLSIRYANIPNLGELELVEIDSKVLKKDAEKPIKLAIQPEGAERIVAEYSTETSLSEIVQSIESKGHEGRRKMNGEVAVVVYMRKEIAGSDLSRTTLKSLGLTGGMSAALRFFYKSPEVLHEQASVFTAAPSTSKQTEEKLHRPMRKNNEVTLSDILPKINEGTPETNKMDKNESKEHRSLEPELPAPEDQATIEISLDKTKSHQETSQTSSESKKEKTEVETMNDIQTISEPEIIHYIDSFIPEAYRKQRNSIIFRMGESVSMKNIDENISDDFFELNINDIKLLHAENIKNAKEAEEGAQLMTRQLRESQAEGNKLNLMNKYKKCIIRIQFPPPDRLVLQGAFTVTETIEDVIDFVQHFIQDQNAPIYLFTTPPKTILDSKSSLIDQNCFPSAILHFGQEGKETTQLQDVTQLEYLKPELLSLLSNGTGIERSLVDCGVRRNVNLGGRGSKSTNGSSSYNSTGQTNSMTSKNGGGIKRNGSNSSNPGNKLPKWFKPGKPAP